MFDPLNPSSSSLVVNPGSMSDSPNTSSASSYKDLMSEATKYYNGEGNLTSWLERITGKDYSNLGNAFGDLYSSAADTMKTGEDVISEAAANGTNAADTLAEAAKYDEAYAEKYLDYNLAEASRQSEREWLEKMSSTEIQRRVKDLEAAGLNKWLAVQGSLGGASVGASSATSVNGNVLSSKTSSENNKRTTQTSKENNERTNKYRLIGTIISAIFGLGRAAIHSM